MKQRDDAAATADETSPYEVVRGSDEVSKQMQRLKVTTASDSLHNMLAARDALKPVTFGKLDFAERALAATLQDSVARFISPLHSSIERALATTIADTFSVGKFDGLSMSARTAIAGISKPSAMIGTDYNVAAIVASRTPEIRGISPAFGDVSAFTTLGGKLEGVLPRDLLKPWTSHLADSVLPASHVLGLDWNRPVGILAPLEDASLGATMSWLLPSSRDGRTKVAALVARERADANREVAIEVQLDCAFCGKPLLKRMSPLEWHGNRKGILRIAVVPMCPTCIRREADEPGYARRALREFRAGSLRVVGSGGKSDGVPRGKLRLVEREDEDDRGE